MKIKIKDNQLQVTCDNEQEITLYNDWFMHNLRQYRHNDNSGLVFGLDINATKLVEPQKPAYRVYKDRRYAPTYTQDRDSQGNVSKVCMEDSVEWLSDWIEYDPPKKWPTPLVERIAAIDIKAAEWIVEHWDELLDDRYTLKGMYSRESDMLSHAFAWSISDIDSNIWENISTKLGE